MAVDDALAPGAWATYGIQSHWRADRGDRKFKTGDLQRFAVAPSLREPMEQSSTRWTGKRMDEKICARVANIGSVVIKIVGQVQAAVCSDCRRDKGPWSQLVLLTGLTSTLTVCSNC